MSLEIIQASELEDGYYLYGSAKDSYANTCHIAKKGDDETQTLCGVTMYRTNYGMLGCAEIGCASCEFYYKNGVTVGSKLAVL